MKRIFTANTPDLTDHERAIIAAWREYDFCADWCAARGKDGKPGTGLPKNVSARCLALIDEDHDAFEQRVRDSAYSLAMGRLEQQYADAIDRREGYLD